MFNPNEYRQNQTADREQNGGAPGYPAGNADSGQKQAMPGYYGAYQYRAGEPSQAAGTSAASPANTAPSGTPAFRQPGAAPQNTGGYGQGYPQQPAATYAGQQSARSAYTWTPGQGGYYSGAAPKAKKKKHAGRFFARALALVLVCAVVSMGSVGAFAWMIQTGRVNIASQGEENTTAAFTIYKQADSGSSALPTVSSESLSPQEIAAKVTPSVVLIQNYQMAQQSGSYFFGFGWGYDGSSDADAGLTPAGEGSGIIISKDGYIVTNQHVIDGAYSLKVVTSEGLSYEAELVGEDTQTDLAVIKITTEDELSPAEFGSSDDLQVADEVMAVGNPGGSQLVSSVTFGHVSALNRPVTNSSTGYTVNCIQTDAAINPGNSGGALVDMNGYVVGINSSKIAATEYEGLGFAIPSNTAQAIVSDLIAYGYVKDRAALGFSGQYIDSFTASWYGMSSGYYVTSVISEEAGAAGVQRGDLILAVDDTQVAGANTLANYIAAKKPGDSVTLTVSRSLGRNRGQETITLEMSLAENTGKSE